MSSANALSGAASTVSDDFDLFAALELERSLGQAFVDQHLTLLHQLLHPYPADVRDTRDKVVVQTQTGIFLRRMEDSWGVRFSGSGDFHDEFFRVDQLGLGRGLGRGLRRGNNFAGHSIEHSR